MIRPYTQNDLEHCIRIFREVGWMDGKDTDKDSFKAFISDTKSLVAELRDEVEVLVATRPGSILYLNNDLPFSGVMGVATSRVARQQGIAARTTAMAIADSAQDGAVLSILGIFDQGYYDKLGYGNLCYQRVATIDPANLRVPRLTRSPKRLTKDDSQAMHDCRLRRKKHHGSCNLHGVGATSAETTWDENCFGLGFENDAGSLTHFAWMKSRGEHGPYIVLCYAFETFEQLVELLSMLRSLSDQVHGIRMVDPPGLQIQDMLDRPFATHRARKGGDFDSAVHAQAWQQCRILDIPTCIGAMKFDGEPVSFNLTLRDPIEKYIPDEHGWRGVGGDWIIRLGVESSATLGTDSSLPTVSTCVNDLTRLWFGASTAEALSITGDFKADPNLLVTLDRIIRLPQPNLDWEF